MKYISRTSAVAAFAALAAPAFAHSGHHDMSVVQAIVHWASQPVHGFGLLVAAAAIVGGVVYSRRQRG